MPATLTRPVLSALDIEMLQQSRASARVLTLLEARDLRSLSLPSEVDYSGFVTLIRQQGPGGCGTMASLAILDVLKERERSNTPDFSYGYAEYLYNKKRISQLEVLKRYGACPEALYPTNYDRGPTQEPELSQNSAAAAYKIKAYGDPITYGEGPDALSPDLIRYYLYKFGPVWAQGALVYAPDLPEDLRWEHHVFAIVGYNDARQEFTIVNSEGDMWGDGGFIKCPYVHVHKGQSKHAIPAIQRVRYVENKPTPLIHPLVGRVDLHALQGRRNLTVRVGHTQPAMEGGAVVIWDRNNAYLGWSYDNTEDVKNWGLVRDGSVNLVLDAPLPGYWRRRFWPPTPRCAWYVEIVDHSPPTPGGGPDPTTIRGFELVDRKAVVHLTPPPFSKPIVVPRETPFRSYVPPREVYLVEFKLTPNSGSGQAQTVVCAGTVTKEIRATEIVTQEMQATTSGTPVAGFPVTLDVPRGMFSPPLAVASTTTDPQGRFTMSFSAPSQTTKYRLVVRDPANKEIVASVQPEFTVS